MTTEMREMTSLLRSASSNFTFFHFHFESDLIFLSLSHFLSNALKKMIARFTSFAFSLSLSLSLSPEFSSYFILLSFFVTLIFFVSMLSLLSTFLERPSYCSVKFGSYMYIFLYSFHFILHSFFLPFTLMLMRFLKNVAFFFISTCIIIFIFLVYSDSYFHFQFAFL